MSNRVAVIGAGVIGLATAWELVRRGRDVVVVERDAPGAGCSAGNAGWVCPSISTPVPNPALRRTGLRWLLRSDSPLYINPRATLQLAPWLWRFWQACSAARYERGASALLALAADAPERYRRWRRQGLEFETHERGLVLVFADTDGLEQEARMLEATGYPSVRRLSASELFTMEPALAAAEPRPAGALHVEPEIHVRPESVCGALVARCRERGVQFLTGFAVERFDLESNWARCVRGPAGEVEADAFVIATGAEAATLGPARHLPIQAGKGYSVTIEEPSLKIRNALHLTEAKLAITPFAGGHRVAGTMELSGINNRLDPRRLAALRRAASTAVPGVLDGAARHQWVGMRPMTPDGLPVMGKLPGMANVYVNTGHQMLGMTLAPIAGDVLAGLIADESPPPSFCALAFDPGRF